MPLSVTVISAKPDRDRAATAMRDSPVLYATALASRFVTAVASWLSTPRTTRPGWPPTAMSSCLARAAVRVRSTASASTWSTSTGTSSGSGSPPCSRERSISSRTRRPRRSASWAMRAAKRCTASGSSAAPSMASASSDSAPTGVFSSWPTLATKSRRTASVRRVSVTSSSTRATGPGGWTVPLSSRTPCTLIIRGPAPTRLPGSRMSARRLPAERTAWASSSRSGTSSRVARTMPSARAAGLASSTASSASTTSTAGSMRSSSRRAIAASGRRDDLRVDGGPVEAAPGAEHDREGHDPTQDEAHHEGDRRTHAADARCRRGRSGSNT